MKMGSHCISYLEHYGKIDLRLNRPYYAKLQLFSSITLDLLRNAWGHLDELRKHVFDALCRGMELMLPYDKIEKIKNGSPKNRFGAIDETATSSATNETTIQRY